MSTAPSNSVAQSQPFAALDWGLLVATALIWGSSFLFIRVAVEHFQPGLVAFLRLAFGVTTLATIPGARLPVPRSAWPAIAVVGLAWMAAPFFLFSIALQWIDSSLAGMLNGSVPLFVAVIASGVARMLPGWRQMLGIVTGLVGVVVVSLPSAMGARATLLGVTLVLLACLSYGIAVNVIAPIQKRHGALPVIIRAELVALVLLSPFGLSGVAGSTFSWPSFFAVAVLGSLGTALAFVAFTTLLGRVGSTRGSIANYFLPVVAMILGALVRHESIGAAGILGTLLIIAGAFLVSRADSSARLPASLAKAAALLVFLLDASNASAQSGPSPVTSTPNPGAVWPLPRLEGPIKIDGLTDDAAWKSISTLPLSVYLPVFGSAPTERTEIRVAYDSDALYVVFDAWESHPGNIRASSMVRDDDAPGDFYNVLIDPFSDRKNAVAFSTTPGGQRIDWTISNDGEGIGFNSGAWNGVWQLATRRDDGGFHAEMRIPFSTLRFTEDQGRAQFGFGVNRLTVHTNERVTFPAVEPSSGTALWKASRLQQVSVEGITTPRSVRLTPYAVAGRDGLRAPDLTASPWASSDHVEFGADFKMALTPNLTLDLTANTDFAEAEVDDQRVNLTRFPLLFPERRQFFVEQAGTFDVKTGSADLMFHSRRVGLSSIGEPVRLLGGARVAGRISGWDVGLFSAQMGKAGGIQHGNLGVVRLRHALRDPRSWLGVMATSRVAPDSTQFAIGVDGELHLGGDDYVSLAAVGLLGEAGVGPDAGVFPRGALRLLAERRRNRGAWYRAAIATTGARYTPALGYVERGDAIRPAAELGYGWVVSPAGHVLRSSVNTALVYRNADAAFDAASTGATFDLELPSGGLWRASALRQDDHLLLPFAPTPATSVPAGRYSARAARVDWIPPNGPRVVLGASATGGEYYDGTVYSGTITPEWRASAHLCTSAEFQMHRIEFATRAERQWSRLARLRILASASPSLSLMAVTQVSSLAKLGQSNIRLRFNAAEGHDLWIVFGHLANLDRPAPSTPPTASASLLMKYTRSFGT